jgi:hypothetical protein
MLAGKAEGIEYLQPAAVPLQPAAICLGGKAY